MRRISFLMLLVLFCTQCNSQEKTKEEHPTLESVTPQTVDENYLLGSWQNTKTIFITANKEEAQKQSDCAAKSYWKFTKENGILKQAHFTAKGNNCTEIISTTYGIANLEGRNLSYFTDDINYNRKITVISENEFTLITDD